MIDPEASVTHRRYLPRTTAHYGGGLLDGAATLALFGDAATELAIRDSGDEGLLAGYDQVSFHAPVRAGDVVEVVATVVGRGRRSRRVEFTARILCRSVPERGPSAAEVLAEPILAVSAT
ncbi:MAG: hotdog domain-containing protein, partial [Mycobacteriales bacterium]